MSDACHLEFLARNLRFYTCKTDPTWKVNCPFGVSQVIILWVKNFRCAVDSWWLHLSSADFCLWKVIKNWVVMAACNLSGGYNKYGWMARSLSSENKWVGVVDLCAHAQRSCRARLKFLTVSITLSTSFYLFEILRLLRMNLVNWFRFESFHKRYNIPHINLFNLAFKVA